MKIYLILLQVLQIQVLLVQQLVQALLEDKHLLTHGQVQQLRVIMVLQEKKLVGKYFMVVMYKSQVEHTILQQLN